MKVPPILTSLSNHIFLLSFLLRILLILYGEWQDNNMAVKYTDVDYLVYNDAARFVIQGESPYQRATYRYTPLLAYLLIPNIVLVNSFGKILFTLLDVGVGYMIQYILKMRNVNSNMSKFMISFWLFNPFVFTVSTRGNADVLIAFLVLGSIYSFMTKHVILGSILYGMAVHLKIYPIFFVFAILLYLTPKKSNIINWNTILFGLVSGGTFFILTGFCWYLYGFEFVYETYLYHLVRRDNRHNFSVYFYNLYLQFSNPASISGLLAFFPQIIIMIATSIRFYSDLPFCLFIQTIAFVAFNKVCTAQYFVWFLSLLPLVVPHANLSLSKGILLIIAFFVGELHWLFWGYQLEFLGNDVFLQLWGAGLVFFIANIYIMVEMISNYEMQ